MLLVTVAPNKKVFCSLIIIFYASIKKLQLYWTNSTNINQYHPNKNISKQFLIYNLCSILLSNNCISEILRLFLKRIEKKTVFYDFCFLNCSRRDRYQFLIALNLRTLIILFYSRNHHIKNNFQMKEKMRKGKQFFKTPYAIFEFWSNLERVNNQHFLLQ